MIPDQRAIAGEIQVDTLARPGGRQVDRATYRRRAAAQHNHRSGTGQPLVCCLYVGADLGGRLQCRPPPEAVADSRRNDQRVVLLGDCRAVLAQAEDGSGRQIHSRQRGLYLSHPVQAPELVERNPVVAGPIVWAGEPDSELLATDQRWFDRNSDDVGVGGQADGGQDADITEPGDDNAFAVHVIIPPISCVVASGRTAAPGR